MLRRPVAFIILLLLATTGARAWGDMSPVYWVTDDRGRVASVSPRDESTIALKAEMVTLIPFYEPAHSRLQPLLFVNARFDLVNPGAAREVATGFPELKSRVRYFSKAYEEETERVTFPATIIRFFADVGGQPLEARAQPGQGIYRRWFVFQVPVPQQQMVAVRTLYVAHLGRRASNEESFTERFHPQEYSAEYVLHTGAPWQGKITHGDIAVWDGGWRLRRRFRDLEPTEKDDISLSLNLVASPSKGRPLFSMDYGNTSVTEPSLPSFFNKAAVVRASTSLQLGPMPSYSAMVLDRDARTSWIDGGPHGGVGQWIQVPTHALGRIRGLTIQGGTPPAGVTRIKEMTLTCFDLQGNRRVLRKEAETKVALVDQPGAQRILFPRPLGPCYAVRMTVQSLHGPSTHHAAIAEMSLITH